MTILASELRVLCRFIAEHRKQVNMTRMGYGRIGTIGVRPRNSYSATMKYLKEGGETVKTMKCLSVQQPWAWLLVTGQKDIENRTWTTQYRGPLLIHAGKKFDWEALGWLKQLDWDICAAVIDHFGIDDVEFNNYGDFTGKKKLGAGEIGGIVGMVNLCDVVKYNESRWAMRNRFHWLVDGAKELPFLRCPGTLRLYDFNVDHDKDTWFAESLENELTETFEAK